MKNISEKKTIDVTGVNFSPIAAFKQGDAAVLKLELFKNGEVFNISGQTVKLGAYRPNKTIVEQLDGFTIDNNTLTINLKNNILAVYGIVEVDLTLTDSAGEMTTASFYLKVNKKVLGNDNIAASDEIDSLKQIKLDLTALNENVKREENTRVANEKSRVSEEKIRKANETERVNFYEDIAKPLVEDLSQYDKEIENIYHTIRENDYLTFEGENVTVEHSLTGMTKDMIIDGRTLQNLAIIREIHSGNSISGGIITLVANGTWGRKVIYDTSIIKPNTKYTIIINCISNTVKGTNTTLVQFYTNITGAVTTPITYTSQEIGLKKAVITTKDDTVGSSWWLEPQATSTSGEWKGTVIILEGDYTNKYIPGYFEGIKSVGEKESKISILSTGKNIYNKDKFKLVKNKALETDNGNTYDVTSGMWYAVLDFMPIPSFKNNIYLLPNSTRSTVCFYDINKNFVGYYSNSNKTTIPTNAKYFRFDIHKDDVQTMQIELTDVATPKTYEPYKEDKKEILLPIEDGLKGLNGVYDTLESRKDGVYCVEKVKKYSLSNYINGNWYNDSNRDKTMLFYIALPNLKASSDTLSNNFITDNGLWSSDTEGITVDGSKVLQVRILRSKLNTQDVEGFKAWLQANPTVVYCEIEEQIETKLDVSSLNLETFKDTTHVFSENSISPNLSFKAPVDVPATISTLRTRNESLEQENKELKEEVSVKTLKLHGQDVELTNSDLDLDFRIFELEMSIGLPINLNMKGMRNMARSPFEMMKILVLNNNYDREDIEYKASRYLQGKRMTQVEYDEIISLMDANELVK